jgi:hypothetical protein
MSSKDSDATKFKTCIYGCNTQIFWNADHNEYWEAYTSKKHICPNRGNYGNKPTSTSLNTSSPYRKGRYSTLSKPKMDNSFELLQGSVKEVQKQYEVLLDIIRNHNGKVHGSQRDKDVKTGMLDIIVYYEVPEGQREEVKRIFEFARKRSNIVT